MERLCFILKELYFHFEKIKNTCTIYITIEINYFAISRDTQRKDKSIHDKNSLNKELYIMAINEANRNEVDYSCQKL